MCTDPVLLCLDEPAAGLNPRESAELNELLLLDPRRTRHLDPADRARHVGGDGDFGPHRRARLRREDRRRHAGESPHRPEGDRRLSRRRGRGGRARSKRRSAHERATACARRRCSPCAASRPIYGTIMALQGRRPRRQRGRDRHADRRQRRRQVDPDDDDLRQAARARGHDHLRAATSPTCRPTRSRGWHRAVAGGAAHLPAHDGPAKICRWARPSTSSAHFDEDLERVLRAVPAPEGARSASAAARCRAASSRCWRSPAR